MVSVSGVIGYTSLLSLQEANQIRELSLAVENEFLLARQNEANFLINQRSIGFAGLTAYSSGNRRHLEQARIQLTEMKQRVKTAQDPTLRSIVDDINELEPLLSDYETAFLATVGAVDKRVQTGGLENTLKSELELLETNTVALTKPDFRLLIFQARAEEQAYLNTNRAEYIDNVRWLMSRFIALVESSAPAELAGATLSALELVQHAQNYQAAFTQLVELDQGIQTNTAIFQEITLDISNITESIAGKSAVGVQRVVQQTTAFLVVAAILALALGVLAAINLARSIITPLNQLSQAAQQIGAGRLEQTVTVAGGQELATLAETFNVMTNQLRQMLGGLERQVAKRTQDLEKRATQIATGAEVARVATTLLDPEQLIPRVVELIRERFRFYYVGLFLVDAENRYAILQHGAGVGTAAGAGRTMKERSHKLEIGGGSMIGWTCANRQARIALDVGKEAVRFANPLTPETRSEMALPLRAGERVIGALTIQSVQETAFDEDDIASLQGMADQIAVALENARLFAESRATLEATRRAYGQLSRQGWAELLHARPALGLRKSGTKVTPVQSDATQAPHTQAALQTGQITPAPEGNCVAAPVKVRDQVIGVIEARKPAKAGEWTTRQIALLEALTDQMSTALEGARLYQDTRRRAAYEQLVAETTAHIRESLDISTVLQVAAREMRQALNLTEVEVRMGVITTADENADHS